MILSSLVILSVYRILVCLILIAVFAVFSQILKFRLDFIPVSVVACTLYGILAGYWPLGYYFSYFTSSSSSSKH